MHGLKCISFERNLILNTGTNIYKFQPVSLQGPYTFPASILCYFTALYCCTVWAKQGKEKGKPTAFVETKHQIKIAGEDVAYAARAGKLTLKDGKGKARADVFYIAYLKEGVENPEKRPITFCFNGGPGSSAVCRSNASIWALSLAISSSFSCWPG